MSDFSDRLQALMAARGLKQSDMARRMGVGRPRMNHWYWGISEPRIEPDGFCAWGERKEVDE